jgi:hypothetical protein
MTRACVLVAAIGISVLPISLVAVAQDAYHQVPLAQLATTKWTHACTIGLVVYVRRQRDGDVHVTLVDGAAKAVAEIISAIPLPRPTKGQRILVCGITRVDRAHAWAEIHPVLSYRVLAEAP